MTPPFSNRSLHHHARAVLAHYDLHNVRLRLLSNMEHSVFQVDATTSPATAERFTLRLYNPTVFDAPSVQTEVEWLTALVREAGLIVPDPVPLRNGGYILHPTLDTTEPAHPSVLFRWVAGRRRKSSLSSAALEQVGQFTARLHQHAQHFRPSVGTAGQHWNWERVFGGTSIVGLTQTSELLSADQQALFRTVAHTVRDVMQRLGQSPNVWGLIHADLHTSNYLFYHNTVRAIDFEDCGWGYYLYDLAVILDELYAVYPAQAEQFRAALLHGYRQVRPLSEAQAGYLNAFIAMRLAELVRWYGSSAQTEHHASARQVIAEASGFLQRHHLCAV